MPQTIFDTIERWLARLENVASILGGVMLVAAMVLTSIDALGRYAFHSPLTFQYYLTGNYLMVAICTMPLAWGFRTGGYIRVGVLSERLPNRIRDLLLRAGLILSAAYIALLAWKSGQYFLEAYRTNQTYVEEYSWPVAWSWVWIPVGCGLLSARLLLTAFGPNDGLNTGLDGSEEI